MESFTIRLNNITGAYKSFIGFVLNYVKKKPSRLDAVEAFMDEHPASTTSDILWFISNQRDVYEDMPLEPDCLEAAKTFADENPTATGRDILGFISEYRKTHEETPQDCVEALV